MARSQVGDEGEWGVGSAVRRFLMWLMVAAFAVGGLIGASMFLVVTNKDLIFRTAQTLWALGLHAAAALFVMRTWVRGTPSWPIAAGLIVFAVNFLALLAGIWVLPTDLGVRAWPATGLLFVYSLLLWPAAVALKRKGLKALGLTAAAWHVLACAAGMAAVWTALWDHWRFTAQVFTIGLEAAAALSLTCVLMLIDGPPLIRIGRLIVLPFIWAAATMFILASIEHGYWDIDLYVRGISAVTIVALCGLIALAVASRLTVEKGRTGDVEIALHCPVCDTSATVRSGESTCAACGTGFSIRLKPTRCVRCGYSLGGLVQKQCPECGLRW